MRHDTSVKAFYGGCQSALTRQVRHPGQSGWHSAADSLRTPDARGCPSLRPSFPFGLATPFERAISRGVRSRGTTATIRDIGARHPRRALGTQLKISSRVDSRVCQPEPTGSEPPKAPLTGIEDGRVCRFIQHRRALIGSVEARLIGSDHLLASQHLADHG